MTRVMRARSWLWLVCVGCALSAVLASSFAVAMDEINCGDPKKLTCTECGGDDLKCCRVNTCATINQPPTTGSIAFVGFNNTAGGEKLLFQRHPVAVGLISFKLKESLASVVAFSLKGDLSGNDAGIGGLLYPVVFLGMGDGALDALHAHGYDVTLPHGPPSQTCQAVLPAQTCTKLAFQLSQHIDAALKVADPAEDNAFVDGAQSLGYPSCSTP